MYVEMTCSCDSSFSFESDEESTDAVLALTFRFASAHVKCGFMTSGTSPEMENEPTVKKRIIKPKNVIKEEEDD